MGRSGVNGFVLVYLWFSSLFLFSFSFLVDGSPVDFFGSSWGLRQGDLLSHMLFLFMMEFFSGMLKRVEGASLIRGFEANGRQGDRVCVSHLLFANYTILFCEADVE